MAIRWTLFLHFFGGPHLNKWHAQRHEGFGATAYYLISADRLPKGSYTWVSSPFVELFGAIQGHAASWDPLQRDGIASCNLFLRQTISHVSLGVIKTIAEASTTRDLVHTQNDYSYRAVMPGFHEVPAVFISKPRFNPYLPLLAEVEVRFEIFLKSVGSDVSCSPSILLRNFQWPLRIQK